MCGDVQLWQLSDSTELYANGAGTRSAIPSTRNKPGLRSVDANYSLYDGGAAPAMSMPLVSPAQGTSDASRTLVAIIDSGTDPDHPALSSSIRLNGRETHADGADNDGNCLKDDILGFNFLDNNNIAYDDHGHGTAVGGIAAGIGTPALSSTDASVALLPIKYTNRFGQGTTFEAACAIYYAVDYHRNRGTGTRDEDSVRVINASWGYRGEFSEVLYDAISYAGRRCGVLFVCAAGNEGLDMDADNMGNYPVDFALPNILVVAAADGAELAPYSNYGRQSADIAAFGTFTQTLAPQQTGTSGINPNAISGTSFATPYVSRAAAILFNEYPSASAEAVKEALLATATPLTSADSSLLASGGMVDLTAALAYMANMSSLNFCTAVIGVEETLDSENASSNYILYPNPAGDLLQIAFSAEYEQATVLLFDAKGVEISRQQAGGASLLTLSLAGLPQGLYLVQIRTKGQIETHKVLKID
jgi:subtilisin family serine protease